MSPLTGTAFRETDQENQCTSLVDFEGPADPDNPLNWPFLRKIWVTSVLAVLNLIGTVASSIFETGSNEFRQAFNISNEVVVLGTSLFLAVGLHLR
jgi:hypothetical protein